MEINLEFEAITKKMASLLPTCSIVVVVEEALVRLFNYVSSSFQLLLLCLFTLSIFLLTFFTFIGRFPLIQRDQQYEYVLSDDEEEQEEPNQEKYCYADSTTRVRDHIVVAADSTICGRGTLLFQHNKNTHSHYSEEFITPRESLTEEKEESHSSETTLSIHNSPQVSDFETEEAAEEEEFPATNADNSVTHSVSNSVTNPFLIEHKPTSPTTLNLYKDDHVYLGGGTIKNRKVKEENLTTRDERFFVFAPTELHSKKLIVQEKDDGGGGESCSDDGSTTSKEGSSEWRSSIHFKDYETDHEDQFSSSSRRSCPKWESYTLFQKYDEEMSFLDRISAQKLQETESLKSIQVSPRSISERMAHKFSTANKTPADTGHNPYRELEAAYVAQICLTWEALNWNYRNFQSKHASRRDTDTGCPATVAQQFQQFQVLLQRYIENEPYEHGRRPEIYARMRLLAPKLLLVPEYRDSEDNQKDGGLHSRISSASFLMIMEDGIRTFMKFLKADKEKPCQILATYFRPNRRCTVDPTLLRLMKKVNQKKRMKVKDLQRSRKCLRKRKMKVEAEGMDILMAKIDLKVVARVLRMSVLNEAQLHWCEEKMSKVRIMSGKLHTDYSTPLFFPSHCNSLY